MCGGGHKVLDDITEGGKGTQALWPGLLKELTFDAYGWKGRREEKPGHWKFVYSQQELHWQV